MVFEQHIQKQLFTEQHEKTFIDKLLAREDVAETRKLIKKDKLTRSDLQDLLHLLTSVESKLLNYSDWDRYVILKYFVWLREFVAVGMQLYDYQDDIEQKVKDKKLIISDRARKLFENNMRLMEHNIKFLVDLYFNIGRSTLSLGATGILELLKNKYEVIYPGLNPMNTPVNNPQPIKAQ